MNLNLVTIPFKNDDKIKGYIFNVSHLGLPFNKVYVAQSRYQLHILNRHPDINEVILKQLFSQPDYVLRENERMTKNTYHFRKTIDGVPYAGVVMKGYMGNIKPDKSYLLSAFSVYFEKFDHDNSTIVYGINHIVQTHDCRNEIFEDKIYDDDMYNFNFGTE